MAVVHVPSAMRELTEGAARIDVAGDTVREVIEAMEAKHPGFRERLLKDGKLRPGMQVFVDGVSNRSGLRARVKEETRVHFIPAMAGGAWNSTSAHSVRCIADE
ncbi:MAG: MoaD/ThiS family protein [Chloroflexi bacterium]|nr:MoaD/ThiS family protein [Chloroflexota bacterium]